MVAGDDPVIDLLDLFRDKSSADSLDDVLVISLAVETTVNGVIVNTGPQRIVVVVDDCEVLGFVIFEDYYPVESKTFYVICDEPNS